MANDVPKRQNLAAEVVDLSSSLMDLLNDIAAVNRKYTKAGVTFADSDFTDKTGLEHLTAAEVTAAITSLQAVAAFVSDNFHDTNMEKVRR